MAAAAAAAAAPTPSSLPAGGLFNSLPAPPTSSPSPLSCPEEPTFVFPPCLPPSIDAPSILPLHLIPSDRFAKSFPHVRYYLSSSTSFSQRQPQHHRASSNSSPRLSSSPTARRRSLIVLTDLPEASDEPRMSLDDMPDSPPDLSSSKSSTKSDSLDSAHDFNGHDAPTDISHFEDISLADAAPTPTPATRKTRVTAKPRPLIKTAQSTPLPMRSPRYNKSSPNLRNSLRLSPAQAHSQVHPSHAMRSPPSPLRSFGASSPSLTIPSFQGGRSRSPRDRRRGPLSPRSPNGPASPGAYFMNRRRDSSIMRKRKTAQEIEMEYAQDEHDDDIPADFVIANIPLSPCPQAQSGVSSEDTSPERPTSSSSNDTQAKSSTGEYRARSWDTAMLGLSMDVRELTSKLNVHHVDELKRYSDPQTPRPGMSSRAVTLPPLQRGDAVIDPMPCSKEKEKHLSRTRPGWLPPKSKSEEKKHLQQYKQIMSEYLAAEKRKSQEQEVLVKTREETEAAARRSWEMHILPQWNEAMTSGRARHLWWQGIPANLRGKIWARAIGNDLHLSHGSYEAALARAKALEQRLQSSTSSQLQEASDAEAKANKRSKRSIALQAEDIETAFPEHQLFQAGQPFHARLKDILAAYAAYRSDTGHVFGAASIAALLLVHIPEPGRCFVALANLLNRPTSLAFCLNESGAKDRTFSHILRGMKYKTPQLHEHLTNKLALKPDHVLGYLCRSLLTGHLEMTEAARVFDVLVFEGDGVVVRSIIAYLAKHEGCLYGSEQDVLDVLSKPQAERGGAGAGSGDAIIDYVRWAGKEEADRPKS